MHNIMRLHIQTSRILCYIYINPSRTSIRFTIVRYNYLRDRSKSSISATDINVTFAHDNALCCTAHTLLHLPTYAYVRGFTYAHAWAVLAHGTERVHSLCTRDRLIDSLMHPGNPVCLSFSFCPPPPSFSFPLSPPLKVTALPRKYAPMSITLWYR